MLLCLMFACALERKLIKGGDRNRQTERKRENKTEQKRERERGKAHTVVPFGFLILLCLQHSINSSPADQMTG